MVSSLCGAGILLNFDPGNARNVRSPTRGLTFRHDTGRMQAMSVAAVEADRAGTLTMSTRISSRICPADLQHETSSVLQHETR
jgi:hypothetical protein